MTLGPKFYTKLVSAITRRRKRVRRSYRLESSPIFLQILNLLSKQDVQKSDFSPKRPLRESLMIPFLYITANSFLFYCILVYSILFYFIFSFVLIHLIIIVFYVRCIVHLFYFNQLFDFSHKSYKHGGPVFCSGSTIKPLPTQLISNSSQKRFLG